ncbi:type I restriction enzyme HsdR N-terminal domain-containing protein [Hymenobacter monticola]|uniref:Type I restriction enzyme HsdR N-terminal domain-containing protein n=1 Tax=Hymenobacter monticola TaxID=1705399 RepID=A0ABY4B9E3_9BACT|nr:type I restriction enzyme HsdR N-terminal domain-containing protein [Hymenobacter monticola]UOE35797.1 type I restriction enzyme HsdR N-terminal domain-containing protein [Hymenobacter monticola]
MTSASPLVSIYQVIQQIRSNAAANPGIFQKNEAATRAALIDPILRSLGWDTTNVRMVEPERTVENKQSLDYVLKDAVGNIRAVIEAKKLGESLDKLGHVGALIGYAFSLKPQTFFITDGLNWHCYSPAHSHYQPIETLNLRDEEPVAAALQLIRWLDAALSGHGIHLPVAESTIPSPAPTADFAPKSKPVTTKQPKHSAKQEAEETAFTDVSQLHQLNLPQGQKPKQLRLPNGTVKPISTWKDILLEVCGLLLKTNTQLPIPFPDKAGKKSFLFSLTKPAKGSSALTMYKNQPLFIYTNYSAEACISNALYAAKHLPHSQQVASLAVSF